MNEFKSIFKISNEEELKQRIENKTTDVNELDRFGNNALTSKTYYILNKSDKFIEILIKSGINVNVDYCLDYVCTDYLCELIFDRLKNKNQLNFLSMMDHISYKWLSYQLTKDKIQSKLNFMTRHGINLLEFKSHYLLGSNNFIEALLDKVEQLYSKDELIKFILTTHAHGGNIFQCNYEHKDINIYKFIMNKLPIETQIELLMHKNSYGHNVLLCMVIWMHDYDNLSDIINDILKNYSDCVRYQINDIDGDGYNILYHSINNKKCEYSFIKKLIDIGADTNVVYRDENSEEINLIDLIKLKDPPFADELINYIKYGDTNVKTKSASKRSVLNII